jgi:surface carbohydrate biosynthesis protein (TIGR04326 family)
MEGIVLAFPFSRVEAIKKYFGRDEIVTWLYFGRNSSKRRLIEQKLGNKFQRIDIARMNDEVARETRHEFVEWIDDLNRSYGHEIEWWFGSVSSRNIHDSNIFQYCCYLEILERLSKKEKSLPKLIIIESVGLGKSIKKWGDEKSLNILFLGRQFILSIRQIARFILRWSRYFTSVLLRWVAAFITRYQSHNETLIKNKFFLIDTFVHDYCLSQDGSFRDRYFPYLHEYLQNRSKRIIIHPVLHGFKHNYFSIYKRMRMSSSHFLIQEDFLRLADYFSSLTYPIRAIRRKIMANRFRDFDIDDIVREDRNYNSSISGMHPILICRLFQRIGESGFQLETIINWYENQVIDKALIAGCRKAFPETQILGAQLFIHTMNSLNLYPCESEVEFNVTPDILLETSAYQCKNVQVYSQAIPCSPVAALRYAHVFQDQGSNVRPVVRTAIVVILPFDMCEAIELLEVVKESLVGLQTDMRILIKCHPDYKTEDIIHAFGKDQWPSRFLIFEGNIEDTLEQAAVVISSYSSSMVEAAAKGVPVIFVGRQTALNLNPLENLNLDIYTECYTSDELIQAVDKYIHPSAADADDFKKMGQTVRDIFFTPINESTMQPFLGQNQRQSR